MKLRMPSECDLAFPSRNNRISFRPSRARDVLHVRLNGHPFSEEGFVELRSGKVRQDLKHSEFRVMFGAKK
jgi:hypothetical protein